MRYVIELTVAFAVILIFAGSSYADLQPDNQTLQTQAAQGDAKAQFTLGWRYAKGLGGLPQDYAKAREWYEKAAAQGNTDPMAQLAKFYEEGLGGLPKDYTKAMEWWEKAVANESPEVRSQLPKLRAYYKQLQLEESGKGGVNSENASRKSRTLIHLSAMYQLWIDIYEFSKPQWEFNVRYGAPPISNKLKKRLESDFPNAQKEINTCHKRLIGRSITAEEITRARDEDQQSNPMWATTRSLMKMMGGGPRVPQKQSELNAASDFEMTVNLSFTKLEEFLNTSDKDWCSRFSAMQ